jgi:GMP synthase (glutamine-hydrolysing)
VAFEDLGSLGTELALAGVAVDIRDACCDELASLDFVAPELVVVLGGPVGVYEEPAYPFLRHEIAGLRARLHAKKPTLGICLGAQLMAAALGARVYSSDAGKEIGWGKLKPAAGLSDEIPFAEFLRDDPHVLHWHGDTFDLPNGARLLASSEKYPHQAFALGDYGLGLQFHLEVAAHGLERWYVGHSCELAKAGIDVPALREAGRRHAPALEALARPFWRRWISQTLRPPDAYA